MAYKVTVKVTCTVLWGMNVLFRYSGMSSDLQSDLLQIGGNGLRTAQYSLLLNIMPPNGACRLFRGTELRHHGKVLCPDEEEEGQLKMTH